MIFGVFILYRKRSRISFLFLAYCFHTSLWEVTIYRVLKISRVKCANHSDIPVKVLYVSILLNQRASLKHAIFNEYLLCSGLKGFDLLLVDHVHSFKNGICNLNRSSSRQSVRFLERERFGYKIGNFILGCT